MNRNSASQVKSSNWSGYKNTTQNQEQYPPMRDVVRSSATKISEDEFIAFEDFLNRPDTNDRIEIAAERHLFSGSEFAYDTAIQEVAYRDFHYPNANSHVKELLRMHKLRYALYKKSEIEARVNNILKPSSDARDAEIELSESQVIDLELPDLTHTIDQFPPFGVSPALLDLLADIESMHVKELSVEDRAQYSTLDVLGRLDMWENHLFKNDPLYAQLRALRTRENTQE